MTTQQPIAPTGSGRKVLLLIVGIPVAIILASTLMYHLTESRSIQFNTVNKGTLIVPPVRFSDIEMVKLDGSKYLYTQPAPKWTFVIFGGSQCDGECEKMLYLSRQSHIALGKKLDRVRRFYVTYDTAISSSLSDHLAQHYKDTSVIVMKRESVQQLFADTGVDPFQANQFFVVDERGWLMMYYIADDIGQAALNQLGKDVLKDMRRLIK